MSDKIVRQKSKKDRILNMLKHYHAPTVDVYFELKVCQYQFEKMEKEIERKKNIERLKKINEKHRQKPRQSPTKRPTFKRKVKNIRLGSPSMVIGQVYKGSTFDIVYSTPT